MEPWLSMTCPHRHSGTNVSTRYVWAFVPSRWAVMLAKGQPVLHGPVPPSLRGWGRGLLPPDFCPTLLLCHFRDSRALFSCFGRLALLWYTPVAWMASCVFGMPGLAACLLTTGATLPRSWTLLSASKHSGLVPLESGLVWGSPGPLWNGRGS